MFALERKRSRALRRLACATLDAGSCFYVVRAPESDSDPAREVDNEKNKQKGSKNAATNIHLILRLTYEAVLNAESVSAVWAVPHHRGVVEIGPSYRFCT
jgi:hypothetical protein